jgi:hypothetical protein
MEYAGLNSLFSSILSVLNLAELGVGTAMVYSMYKPIVDEDHKTINALMRLYKIYYRIIGLVILVAGLAVLSFIEKLINGVDTLIDSVGGLKGVLAIASAMLLKFAAPQISKGIQNAAYNIKGFVGLNKKEAVDSKDTAFKELEALFVDMEKKSAGGYENAQ